MLLKRHQLNLMQGELYCTLTENTYTKFEKTLNYTRLKELCLKGLISLLDAFTDTLIIILITLTHYLMPILQKISKELPKKFFTWWF